MPSAERFQAGRAAEVDQVVESRAYPRRLALAAAAAGAIAVFASGCSNPELRADVLEASDNLSAKIATMDGDCADALDEQRLSGARVDPQEVEVCLDMTFREAAEIKAIQDELDTNFDKYDNSILLRRGGAGAVGLVLAAGAALGGRALRKKNEIR
jgi:hypothetical protein